MKRSEIQQAISDALGSELEKALTESVSDGNEWSLVYEALMKNLSQDSHALIATYHVLEEVRKRQRSKTLRVERESSVPRGGVPLRPYLSDEQLLAMDEDELTEAESLRVMDIEHERTLASRRVGAAERFGIPVESVTDKDVQDHFYLTNHEASQKRRIENPSSEDMAGAEFFKMTLEEFVNGDHLDLYRFELSRQRLREGIDKIMNAYADDLKIKWTQELLDSAISMPDGTQTTWGAATLDQHRTRRDMFLANAAANTEGAARHEVAIRELESSHSGCLNDLMAVA